MNTILSQPYNNFSVLSDVDHFFGNLFPAEKYSSSKPRHLSPAVDIVETDAEYVLKTDLPGIDKNSLVVSVSNNLLTIEAKTAVANQDKENQKALKTERYNGAYKHLFRLDASVNADNIKADYKDGVLAVSLPKSKKPKQKLVEVVKH